MRNNVIAVVAVCFVTVGTLWGIGNLLKPEPEDYTSVQDIILIAQRSSFNATNPDITVSVNTPTKLVVRNSDAVTHDLKVDVPSSDGITPIDTAPLRGGQEFLTAIVASKPGTYEYYCSYHPEMHGKIIAQ
jgi:plastocyanin